MNLSSLDFIVTLPLWSLALFSLVPLMTKALAHNKEIHPLWLCIHAGLGFCFSIGSLLFINYEDKALFSNLLRLDFFSWLVSFVILILALMTLPLLLAKKDHVMPSRFFSEYIFLFMNSVLGLLLILWSNNMITAFVAIEHISLCFYLMIPLAKGRESSIEAGIKYFVLGSVGACLLLLGIAFVYISSGTIDFDQLISQSQVLVQSSYVFLLGVAFIVIALLFKVSIFPFQFWLADVYQGSATPLACFMSTAVKASVFMLLVKVISFAVQDFEYQPGVVTLLNWLCILTLLVGHVSAFLQDNFKRMLIYSSVAHAGTMLMAFFGSDLFALSSLIYYMMVYGVVNFGALAFVMFFERESTIGVSSQKLEGFYQRKPLYALCLTWFLLNLAGLPPTAGFFAKLFIFKNLVQEGYWWILFWAVIGSAVGLYYYLKPVILMYSESKSEPFFENLKQVRDVVLFCFITSLILTAGAGVLFEWMNLTQ